MDPEHCEASKDYGFGPQEFSTIKGNIKYTHEIYLKIHGSK